MKFTNHFILLFFLHFYIVHISQAALEVGLYIGYHINSNCRHIKLKKREITSSVPHSFNIILP